MVTMAKCECAVKQTNKQQQQTLKTCGDLGKIKRM